MSLLRHLILFILSGEIVFSPIIDKDDIDASVFRLNCWSVNMKSISYLLFSFTSFMIP